MLAPLSPGLALARMGAVLLGPLQDEAHPGSKRNKAAGRSVFLSIPG